MMNMNPVAMMVVISLSGSLLIAPSCDAAVVHKICQFEDLIVEFFYANMRSQSKETMAAVNKDEPDSVTAQQEPLPIPIDDKSLAYDEDSSRMTPPLIGMRRRRSVRSFPGCLYDLLRLCCVHGCDDKDIIRGVC